MSKLPKKLRTAIAVLSTALPLSVAAASTNSGYAVKIEEIECCMSYRPSISGNGRFIAYEKRGEKSLDIVVLDLESKELKNVGNELNNLWPDISYDGSKIVFETWTDEYGQRRQVRLNDGKNEVMVSENGHHPAISADGRDIAYVSEIPDNRGYDLEVMLREDGKTTNISNNPLDDYKPDIADGKVAFVSTMTEGKNRIMLWDGTKLIEVTDNQFYRFSPSISGDGSKIAYSIKITDKDWDIGLSEDYGSGWKETDLSWLNKRGYEFEPKISHDGSYLAFFSNRENESTLYLYVADLKNKTVTKIPEEVDIFAGFDIAVYGDEIRIVYQSFHDDQSGIHLATTKIK